VSEPATLKRSLGLGALVTYGLAYVAPITIFTTYGVATIASGGRLAAAYALATAGILLTALSYGHLAAVFPQAGSVYGYASRALGPSVGFLAGWAIALDYVMIPALNFLIIGIFATALVPGLPPWVWGLAAVAITTSLNLRGIETTDRAGRVILALELSVVGAFAWAALRQPAAETFTRPAFSFPALLAGAALVALSFLGFDAITTLAEEAREPRRDIPRAVVATCLLAGILFVGISAVASRAHPGIVFASVDAAGFEVAEALGGRPLAALVSIGEVVGSLAAGLAGQAGAARLLYGMSRDGGLPRGWLEHLHPKRRTPDNATGLLAAVSVAGLLLPLEEAVSLVNFGALVGFFLVNVSVIAHFVVRQGRRGPRDLLRYALLPGVGAAIVAALFVGLSGRAKLVGGLWLLCGLVRLVRR
jgi:putrescine importer